MKQAKHTRMAEAALRFLNLWGNPEELAEALRRADAGKAQKKVAENVAWATDPRNAYVQL